MTLVYPLPKTGHRNCRRPDKVIDAGQLKMLFIILFEDSLCCHVL